jgi:hypothetical protein
MDGRFYGGFVPVLLGLGAVTVVGTDCELPSLLGAHFGIGVIEALAAGTAIGEAIRSQRLRSIEEYGNPLGLIYRVFGDGEARLTRRDTSK